MLIAVIFSLSFFKDCTTDHIIKLYIHRKYYSLLGTWKVCVCVCVRVHGHECKHGCGHVSVFVCVCAHGCGGGSSGGVGGRGV